MKRTAPSQRSRPRRKKAARSKTASLGLNEYQRLASATDQTGEDEQDAMLVSLLGIVGEAGDLITLFKKRLRDGDSFTVYPEHVTEELGDILWYLANVARKLGLRLEDVATANLTKTRKRWTRTQLGAEELVLLDDGFPPEEQFPRRFTITFGEERQGGRTIVRLQCDSVPFGNALTDNAHFEDGYRYHDVFHLAYAAFLGWSPVTRKLLGCKRKSYPQVDEVEDGGRATVVEEAVSALVFDYAKRHNQLDGVGRIDTDLLNLVSGLTAGFEVSRAAPGDWEQAILQGYFVFRLLNRHRGGHVTIDLLNRSMSFRKLDGSE